MQVCLSDPEKQGTVAAGLESPHFSTLSFSYTISPIHPSPPPSFTSCFLLPNSTPVPATICKTWFYMMEN